MLNFTIALIMIPLPMIANEFGLTRTDVNNARAVAGIERPKIHESAFKRIRNRAHAYAPVGFPATYVVTDSGAIVSADQCGFEASKEALARTKAQEHVWNEIWKRRVVYFATVGAILFPARLRNGCIQGNQEPRQLGMKPLMTPGIVFQRE